MDESKLLEEVKTEFKKNNLDNALLFLCSSIVIILSIIQSVIFGFISFIYFIPLLLFGFMLPFYYGYVKSIIYEESTIDRIKGWIVFISGLFIYISNIIKAGLVFYFPNNM